MGTCGSTSLRVLALLLLAVSALAAPGGYLVEGISDECDALNPIWSAGLRGLPESLSVVDGVLSIRSIDNGDDPYPSAEDMTSTFAEVLGRALDASEGPSVVAWVWLPLFNEWPTGTNASGTREWFGIRVTAYDANLPNGTGLYFPGIYVANDDQGPCLVARVGDGYAQDVTIARVAATGWWTFGLAWNAAGRTEYYAAPGRIALTNADFLHVTPTCPQMEANRSLDQLVGNFVALRMTYPATGMLSTDWRLDNFRVYVQTPPELPLLTVRVEAGQTEVIASGGSVGFRFLLQRSDNLSAWETAADYVADGSNVTFSEALSERAFYRVMRP